MTRKVLVDCDPGIDDSIALMMALYDPRIEVVAITATAGTVDARQSSANVEGLLHQIDPPMYPRIGAANESDVAAVSDDREMHGNDGMGGQGFDKSNHQPRYDSEKVMAEVLRQHPGQITVLCLGPLTNLASILKRDPQLAGKIDRVVISGGAFTVSGNMTPAAEFNFFFDPMSARQVIQSPITKTVIPLDITGKVGFGVDLLEQLPGRHTSVGTLLHPMLQFAFRTHHQKRGKELIPLYDAVAFLSLVEPELFAFEEAACDVEVKGELTRGMTIQDRRSPREWPFNMEIASQLDVDVARRSIVRGIRLAGQ